MPSKAFAPVWLAITLALALPASASERPKLVVALLVDQLRSDYLERFDDQFGPGGFKLFTERGVFMTSAHYDYAPTVTGPGHASFLSGATPSVHGIIGNDWFDKRTGKYINCVDDPSVSVVGLDTDPTAIEATPSVKRGMKSPRNFIGATLADQLRLHYQSKVVGISIKDRGAILPTGKKPTGAYWFDSASGNFITSTYYTPELPEWVRKFNARRLPESFIGQTWSRLLDPKFYTWPDAGIGEAPFSGQRKSTFDHIIRRSPAGDPFEPIVPTPFGNQLMTEFAKAAIEGENLGQGSQPDLLTISFSSNDACGHRFGPYSHEVQDITLRLDRQLADLFSYLDKKIGLANVTIVLTADHGVAPIPEFAAQQGLDGQRVSGGKLVRDLLTQLTEKFGPGNYLRTSNIADGNLYFDHVALQEKNLTPADLAAFIREWAFDTGLFQACYSRDQILDGRTPGRLGEKILNGYNAERSGDMVLVYKPFIIPSGGKTGTTHGSPYSYDTHIPVLFYGAAFKPGRYADEFHITDIAPTLSAALRVNTPPGSMGKAFVKALAQP